MYILRIIRFRLLRRGDGSCGTYIIDGREGAFYSSGRIGFGAGFVSLGSVVSRRIGGEPNLHGFGYSAITLLQLFRCRSFCGLVAHGHSLSDLGVSMGTITRRKWIQF
jgi:hypothetical protein